MKIMTSQGVKFFIGMPIPTRMTMRIEKSDDGFVSLSLSDEAGYMLQIGLNEEMKKELVEVCKNGKKERRIKK